MNRSKKLRGIFKHLIPAIIIGLIMSIVADIGVMTFLSGRVEDLFYQQEEAADERVVVVGITAEDIEEYGYWPWDREVIADVINELNSDPENAPASIGVDILFTENSNPLSDDILASACSTGNVVVACAADYGTAVVVDSDGEELLDEHNVQSVIYPYDELKANVDYGHINANYDSDGILRHHLWSIKDENGKEILSLPYVAYTQYCDYHGIEPTFSIPEDQQYWYVDFSSAPEEDPEYSISDILNQDYDSERIKGHIVLIGAYDTGINDCYNTSIERGVPMFGVQYLSNVVTNMLDNRCVQTIPLIVQNAILSIVTVILAYLYSHYGMTRGLIIGAVTTVITIIASYLLWENGHLLHFAWFIISIWLTFLISAIIHYIDSRGERKKTVSLFSRYVDRKVLNVLLNQDEENLELGGRLVDIAVLFVDIRGFTPLSEMLSPQEIVEILNEFFTIITECIFKYNGTVDKYIGDCVMAFWGAPTDLTDTVACENACRAAVDMLNNTRELSKRLSEKYNTPIDFGIGVHFGKAVVGNMGTRRRLDYTAIGDAVNVAQRLENKAPRGTIYISRRVFELLGNKAFVHQIDEIKIPLKGKKEPIEAFVLTRVM